MGRASYTAFREDRRRGLLTIGPIVIDGTPLARRDQEALLRDFDQDPSDWVLDREEFRPGTVSLTFRRVWVQPAKKHLVKAHAVALPPKGATTTIIITSDLQCPQHDRRFHQAVCAFIKEVQPQGLLDLGDLINFAPLSRFGRNPYWAETVQGGVDAAYGVWCDRLAVAPGAWAKQIGGNHDYYTQRTILANADALYGLHQAGQVDMVFGLPHLLRLPEIGVEWIVDAAGDWPHSRVRLAPKLIATHGWIARKGSGKSALATIEHFGHSAIVGHTHRASQVYHTVHNPDGSHSTHVGIENGTGATIKGGLGYAVAPDWQNSVSVVRVRSDGTFSANLVLYQDGKLFA